MDGSNQASEKDDDIVVGIIIIIYPHLIMKVRVYSHLFTVEEPSDAGWEAELNPESETVCLTARVDPSLMNWNPKVESSFQV